MSSSTLGVGGSRPVALPNSAIPLPVSMEFESNGPTISSLEILDFDSKTWDYPVLFSADNLRDDLSKISATFSAAKKLMYLVRIKFSDCSNSLERIVRIPENSILKMSIEERNETVEFFVAPPCESMDYLQVKYQ